MNYWNNIYKKNKHLSIWPWSELVSKVIHYKKKINKKKLTLLELGCGAGANIPFILFNKINYFGIDFSENIIRKLKKRFKNLRKNLLVGDFKDNHFKNKKFDIIIDRAAITHNNIDDIKKIIQVINMNLSKKGFFIGIDWYSKKYLTNTKKKIYFQKFNKGMFSGIGGVYFFDKKTLLNLFKDFKIIELEEKIIFDRNTNKVKLASWSIVVKKK